MKKGFTLMEILVSVGIIAIVGVVVAQSFFSVVRTNVKSERINAVKQDGDVALDVMNRMIRNAVSVTSTCSAGGSTLSSLSIVNPDGLSTQFRCELDGTIARIASVGGTKTEYLTGSNVTLGSDCTGTLTFVCTSTTSQKSSIEILFTLSQAGTAPDQFEKASTAFQATVLTRQ